MDQENTTPETTNTESSAAPAKKGFNVKIILFGLPIFVIQLIAVYFITANLLLNKVQGNSAVAGHPTENVADTAKDVKSNEPKVELGKFIYSIEDVIVNPAGTNGEQLLLSSIAFDLATEAGQTELKGKEILVKDLIISILSSKSITQLSNSAYKDTLRKEISKKIVDVAPQIKVNKVYFSKYIIN